MEGTIEDTYTIVPKYQGKYPIPPVQFSYFDPKTSNYKTLRSQDLLVDVFEGPLAGSNTNQEKVETKQIISTKENSFRFIQLDTQLFPIKKNKFWLSLNFFILLVLPIGLLLIVIFIKRFILKQTTDSANNKQKQSQRLASKYLSSAKKAFHDQVIFYEALERALHNYLKAKLKIETTEMSKEKIERLLLDKKVNGQSAINFIVVIENCELARYAPDSSVSIKGDYQKAISVIASIDRQL
jgi:hypothetical protein